MTKGGFMFHNGAVWMISFYEDSFIKQLVKSILSDPDMFCGLSVKDIQIIEENICDSVHRTFFLASPILIKRRMEDNRIKFYSFNDVESGTFLVETLKHKMSEAGIPDDDTLKISFDISYVGRKVKKVKIHEIDNIANMCPVIIDGRADVLEFARTVGLGNSTGSGFGCIY